MRLGNRTHEDWTRLGRAVHAARTEAGYGDTREWANAVGRTTRMLLGLERGEQVGGGTLDLVERTLGWPPQHAYRILDDPNYLDHAGLQSIDDQSLAAEVLRRLGTDLATDTENRQLTLDEVRDADRISAILDSLANTRDYATPLVSNLLRGWSQELVSTIASDTTARAKLSRRIAEELLAAKPAGELTNDRA